ncbi:MAG: hypothetical protein AB1938_31195 [Myxococcota bacterium]
MLNDVLRMLLILGAVVVLFWLFTRLGGREFARRRKTLEEVARSLGLALSGNDTAPGMQGTRDGVEVRVETVRVKMRRGHRALLQVTARPLGPLPTLVAFEKSRTTEETFPGLAQVRTGDTAWDAAFVTYASDQAALAPLSSEFRHELLGGAGQPRLPVERCKVDGSEVVLDFPAIDATLYSPRLARIVSLVVALCARARPAAAAT